MFHHFYQIYVTILNYLLAIWKYSTVTTVIFDFFFLLINH